MCERDRTVHARIVSSSSRGASKWLAAAPNIFGRSLANEQCMLALRQRIGAPLIDNMPTKCVCGADLRNPAERGHVHWCAKSKAPATSLRHNHVAVTISSLAKMAGVTVREELTRPTFDALLNRRRKLRPDLLLVGGSATHLVDVVVVHPTSPWRVERGALPRNATDRTLHAIERAEALKTKKYEQLALECDADFIPFACDVFGAMGSRAHQLIDWLVSEASASGRLNDSNERREFRAMAAARLSVAIQRGVAICAVDAAKRIRDDVSGGGGR